MQTSLSRQVHWQFLDLVIKCTLLCGTLGMQWHICAKLMSRLPKFFVHFTDCTMKVLCLSHCFFFSLFVPPVFFFPVWLVTLVQPAVCWCALLWTSRGQTMQRKTTHLVFVWVKMKELFICSLSKDDEFAKLGLHLLFYCQIVSTYC